MQHTRILASMLAAGLVTACGGGGGGDSPPPSDNTSASVSLSGVAAKGTLRNAIVRAHPIASNGSVNLATVLAEDTTDDDGAYSLSFTATASQPYVIRVSPKPAGQVPATTQIDEISGETPVAADFSMRALFVPQTGGAVTTSASVTPFSELAVAAAESGTGGVTAANAAQATVNVTALLGFNPTTVTPTTIAGAGSNAQQLTFATMLTAVSQLANDAGLGCTQTTLADRTKCVVDTLADSASLSSTKPGTTGGVDVSAALVAAVEEVVTDNSLPPTTVAIVTDNLEGTGTPPPSTIGSDVQTAIAAAKTFFNSLRSDWVSIFGRSTGESSAAQAEGEKFETAMRDVQAPVELLIKDSSALLTGIDLYRDYVAGRVSTPTRGRAPATDFVANADVSNVPTMTTVGCTVVQDSTGATVATAPSNANYVTCQAIYYVVRQNLSGSANITRWRHGFTLTPTSATSFTYQSRARQTTDNCVSGVCTQQSNTQLQASAYAGTVTVTADSQERVVGFTLAGDLPGAFEDGGNTLVNEYHTVNLTGTRTPGTVRGDSTATVSGTLEAYAVGGTSPIGTLTLTQATLTEIPVSLTADDAVVPRGDSRAVADFGGELATADLRLTWATPTAAFVGRLTLADNVWDASNTYHVPTNITLAGQFRNIEGDVTTEFLSGTFTVTATGYAQYNHTLPTSATNDWTLGFTFSGNVTAPNRPTLALTLSTSMLSDADSPSSMTAQYRTLVNGTATQTVNISATQPATGAATMSLELVGAGVSMHLTDGSDTASLRLGTASNGTEIGTLNRSNSMLMTYVDGSTASLDFGL